MRANRVSEVSSAANPMGFEPPPPPPRVLCKSPQVAMGHQGGGEWGSWRLRGSACEACSSSEAKCLLQRYRNGSESMNFQYTGYKINPTEGEEVIYV